MPRIKYYNKNTNQWEYADSQYTIGGSANGESGVLCVTVQGGSYDGYTADKTAEDVYEAFMAGKSAVCNIHDIDGNYSLPLLVVSPRIVAFGCVIYDVMVTLKITDIDNTVEFLTEEIIAEDTRAELEEWVENLIDNKLINVVKSVNGITPDANGNVQFSIPDSEGTDVFWVTAAYDPMKNETTCNLTPDEIYRAATGKSVICELNNDGIKIRMVPAAILPHVSVFYTYAPYGTECWLATLVIQENAVQYVETALVTEENIVEAVATVMAQAGVKTESEINEMIDAKLEGFDPSSGGNVGLAITGAEVGQTVRIAEVDENGVPTAWEPADFPNGESESLVVEETLLAAGTIPTGQKQWSTVDTGLTAADIRQWKIFGLHIEGAQGNYFGVTCGNRLVYRNTNKNMSAILKWVDSSKTVVEVTSVTLNTLPEWKHFICSPNADETSIAAQISFFFKEVSTNDATKVTLYTHNELTADVTWEIWGLMK